MADTLADLWREVGLEPSALQTAIAPARPPLRPQRQPFGVRPMPRQMRSAEARAADTRLAPAERTRAYTELQRTQNPQLRGERLPPSNQFAEAGQMVWEGTGVPAAGRSGQALHEGRYGDAAWEGGASLLVLGSLALPLPRGGGPRVAPRKPQLTPIYRGINRAPDAQRAANLGDRWWHTNRDVASSYAPGDEGAHVMLGSVDEGTTRLAQINAPPGTMWRAIPVESLPPDIRRAFPRASHVTTHEVAAAAESLGYEGVTFSGVRDSGFAGRMDTYPGFGTGDEGRVVALFRDDAVRPPFGAIRPPPRLPGRASDGSVLPVRPTEPFRNSLRGGSDDLREATRPTTDAVQPNTPRPTPSDATRGSLASSFRYDEMVREPLAGLRGGGDYKTWYRESGRRRLLTDDAALEEIPLANLTPIQDRVNPNWETVTATANEPIVVYLRGNYYLVDGHHRAARALARGETNLRARIHYPDGRPTPPSSDATRGGAPAQSDGGNPRPPPNTSKSYRSTRKPPSGGFLLPRRSR